MDGEVAYANSMVACAIVARQRLHVHPLKVLLEEAPSRWRPIQSSLALTPVAACHSMWVQEIRLPLATIASGTDDLYSVQGCTGV